MLLGGWHWLGLGRHESFWWKAQQHQPVNLL